MMNEDKKSFKDMAEEELVAYARKRGVNASIIPDEDLPKGRTRITFFGEAKRIPKAGEKIEVRVEDGFWQQGYRAISGIVTDEEYPGERVIWITAEQEWQAARKEGREPDGAPWPVKQMATVEDEADAEA